jgi:hypothetical protein
MYYCNDCGHEDSEIFEKCECGSVNINSHKDEVADPFTNNETSTSIGINASPSDLNHLFDLLALKIGAKDFVYPKFVLNIRKDGVYTNLICPLTNLSTIMYISPKYFSEIWGTGLMPIDSEKVINRRLKWLRTEEECSIVYNTVSNVMMYFNSNDNKMSDNAPAPELVESYIGDLSQLPFKISMETFNITLGEKLYKENYATVRVSEIQRMITKLSDFDKEYYPLTLSTNGLKCIIGDINDPTKTGSFVESISVVDINPAQSDISVKIGQRFKHLFKALPNDSLVTIYFVENNYPIWITTDISNVKGKKVGKIGYLIAPRDDIED